MTSRVLCVLKTIEENSKVLHTIGERFGSIESVADSVDRPESSLYSRERTLDTIDALVPLETLKAVDSILGSDIFFTRYLGPIFHLPRDCHT